jgi:ATP-dependent DNA ligase
VATACTQGKPTQQGWLARIGEGAEGWIALTNGVVGEGRALFRAVVDADLEGVVAKHLADAFHPKLARSYEVMNASYTQRRGRAEWILERRGCYVRQG